MQRPGQREGHGHGQGEAEDGRWPWRGLSPHGVNPATSDEGGERRLDPSDRTEAAAMACEARDLRKSNGDRNLAQTRDLMQDGDAGTWESGDAGTWESGNAGNAKTGGSGRLAPDPGK